MRRQRQMESVVAVAKSASAEYSKVDFRGLLVRVKKDLQGAGVTFPRGGTVFLKPNVVIGAGASESITTDPHFVAALIELLTESGVRTVHVGDSSAGYLRARETFRATGLDAAVAEAGGTWVDIDESSERVSLPLAGSDILETVTVPRKALEADYLINFAKMKTHRVGSFTCCVKNWVGFIDKEVRLQNHQTRLPKLVSELHRALPEDLCFGDGVVVGEGDGPDLSRPRFLGALLASNDPVALDAIGAEILGIHRHDLVFPWTAHLDGVGEIDRNRIHLIGPLPNEIGIRVEKPLEVMYHRFPCNVVLGGVCEGCFAWFMGPALFWQRDGVWEEIRKNVGTPTFMLGFNAVDRNFEAHLRAGPYFVIGDCTPPAFQNDPRTVHVPGCCPGPAIPNVILKACKVTGSDDTT
jgi:uncharacterized protein (DUF362 family)